MATTSLDGVLEIDHERGVVYFHLTNLEQARAIGGTTLLRICGLPKPVPRDKALDVAIRPADDKAHFSWGRK